MTWTAADFLWRAKSTTAGRYDCLTVFLPTTSSQTHQKPSFEPTTNLPPGVFNPTALITSCKQVYWPWGGTTFSSPFISTLILSRMAPDTADLSVLLSATREQNTSGRKSMKRLWHGRMKAIKQNISKPLCSSSQKTCFQSCFLPLLDRACMAHAEILWIIMILIYFFPKVLFYSI